MVIRNVKIKKREGAVVNIKSFLKESRITVGDWIILKAKNLIINKEFTFTANVRDDYRINLRKSIRSNLGLKFNEKTPVELEVVEQLKKIKLRNKALYGLSNSLTDVLPNSVKINGTIVNLNCYKHQKNKIIFSYKNSKSSNYIIIDKEFTFDPFIVGLWRAEGGKYALIGSSFQFTNSNLKVVRAWILFLFSSGFSSKDLRLSYYIQYISPKRDLIREKILINYWSKSLNIPKSRFGWIYKEGLGYKSKYYGSLQIKFNNSTLSFIMQYLFLKFERSFLLRLKNREIAINYIKGALCDCNCYVRADTIKEIRFSTSCIGEAELYSKILFRHFHIFSKIVPDVRNKCFYLIIAG